MPDVFDKCRTWHAYETVVTAGVYPYYRTLTDRTDATTVQIEGRQVLMAGSNDYLGLSTDPRVIAAATTAAHRFGTSCSGSRLLNGTLTLHEELEARLAAFLHREAAIVATTGYQTNLAIAALLGRDDVVFADRRNHASLVDAIRLGHAKHRRYRHNDMAHLKELLSTADPAAGRLIVTDGVFSMDGDLCDLPGIVELAQQHHARVMVDSAHDIGLLGVRGSGAAEHFRLEEQVDLVMATLSKCFGSLGGVLAGPAEVINYVRHRSRSILFSAAMPPANAAAALAALDIIRTEPERRHRTLDLAEALHNGLRALGFDTGRSVSPVVPVHIGDDMTCLRFWTELFAEGIFTNAVMPPAVPDGQAVIRASLSAQHTDSHLARTLDAFAAVGRRLDVIPPIPPSTYQPVSIARAT
ncbi:aminotransferase class I/II-fold pyridoxal phosphate-dependent enzyme [Goodfellowiella coeruleoviolacea]|uniref:8-amino-7-oxononanoate synthase n=1 Tax=Goodfellowiella coeruleoviolacea TaxID=334858 RepID=A0AAE3GJV4_9PSEU|nr:pyridoxal phosphate-dependent aminotransferase family protein [Goodfellowiella coeruleoviolacea]MCP2167503.1 8-amino-7-oxononanoate synthase [Goodfellowiella coeruleoviolacea]